MSTDTPEFWNEIWSDTDDLGSGSDEILADQLKDLTPGRALEIGCGDGRNAVWMAEQGWRVTAVDYSTVAIEKGRGLAAKRGVDVEFVEADAASYEPGDSFDLITSFYIQLFPRDRANMLAAMSKQLAPGGTLLFVSHDKSAPPSVWSEEDLLSLTTPEEVVAELAGLQIEQAIVLSHGGEGPEPSHVHNAEGHESQGSHGSSSTIVRATRPSFGPRRRGRSRRRKGTTPPVHARQP